MLHEYQIPARHGSTGDLGQAHSRSSLNDGSRQDKEFFRKNPLREMNCIVSRKGFLLFSPCIPSVMDLIFPPVFPRTLKELLI
jgi:hypothetical protein